MPSSYNSTKASRSAFWLIAIQAFSIAFALPTNRTIDDTYGDSETGQLVFYSEAGWNTGQLCTGCGVQPDASQVYDRTWHDTTSSPVTGSHSATLTFFGTAIWVYCILVNSGKSGVTIFTNASFELDDAPAGTFQHTPNAQDDQYLYNVVVFNKVDLSNTNHTLVITAEMGSTESLLLFDWAMYTFDNDAKTTLQYSSTSMDRPLTATTHGVTKSTSLAAAGVSIEPTPSQSSTTSESQVSQPQALYHQSHVGRFGDIIGGVLAPTVLCGLLLSFRNNRRAVYGAILYVSAAARKLCDHLQSHRTSNQDAMSAAGWLSPFPFMERSRELPGRGENRPQAQASGLRDQSAVCSTPGAERRGALDTSGVEPLSNGPASSQPKTSYPSYNWERELAAVRAELTELRWYTQDLAPTGPPPAYA